MTHWTNGEHAADLRLQLESERETCAKIAEEIGAQTGDGEGEFYIARKIADAIRARSRPLSSTQQRG